MIGRKLCLRFLGLEKGLCEELDEGGWLRLLYSPCLGRACDEGCA